MIWGRRSYMVLAAALLLIVACSLCAADSTAAEGLASRPHSFPRVGNYEVLCGDFHMHTINSDGGLTTRERVEESYAMGYDVISVTDHGKTKAYRIAKYVGEPLGLVVLRGIETGINGKEHMNVIGVSDVYVPTNSHQWSEQPGGKTVFYQDELHKIAKCGGYVIYNHPHVGFREPVEWGTKEGIIQGIEVKNDVVGNAWNTINSNGIYCYPNGFEYGLQKNLTLFANTDAHGKRNENPAVTLLLSEARTPEAVMDALRARRTAAWFDGMLWGREPLLTDLLKASVGISKDGNSISLENRSPVMLKGVIEGSTEKRFELPAYQKVAIEWSGSDTAVIRWDNVWTSPTTNLKTQVSLAAAGR